MTVKELLHRKVDEMTDEEAEMILQSLEDDEWGHVAPLTPEQLARVDRALAQDRSGRVTPHEEVLRRLGRS